MINNQLLKGRFGSVVTYERMIVGICAVPHSSKRYLFIEIKVQEYVCGLRPCVHYADLHYIVAMTEDF